MNQSSDCQTAEEIRAALTASSRLEPMLEGHLSDCPICREQFLDLYRACCPDATTEEQLAGDADALQRAADETHAFLVKRSVPKGAIPELPGADTVPQQIGDYQIIRELGAGGMGCVYEAYDQRLKRQVALKTILPSVVSQPDRLARFLAEARSAAQIQHPNVVVVHAVEETPNGPYLVQQFVQGDSLESRLAAGPISIEQTLRMARDVAAGLSAAHQVHVTHRDIKPGNILLSQEDGRALVIDFGLARVSGDPRLTGSGYIVGTPEYLAPEQSMGGEVDHRADLFSLGAVMYAALCGHSPFRSDDAFATIQRVRNDVPTSITKLRPETPPGLAKLISRLLQKKPAARPQSAEEVVEQLDQLRLEPQKSQQSPKSKWLQSVVTVGLVALVAIVAWSLRPQSPQKANQSEAASSDTATPVEPAAPIQIVGDERAFDTLADAVDAAADGAVIELNFDGRLLCDPITVSGKSLTIRAASGRRPWITNSVDVPDTKPWLISDSNLMLQGLRISWMIATDDTYEVRPWENCVLGSTGDQLELTNCDLQAGPRMVGCVAGAQTTLIQQCQFNARGGKALLLDVGFDATCAVINSMLEGETAVSVGPWEGQGEDSVLRLDHSHLHSDRAMELFTVGNDRRVQVEAEQTVFEVNQMLHIRGRSAPMSGLTPQERLQKDVLWTVDEQNAYRADCSYVVRSFNRRPMGFDAGLAADLAEWLSLWGHSQSASLSFSTLDEIPASIGISNSLSEIKSEPSDQ